MSETRPEPAVAAEQHGLAPPDCDLLARIRAGEERAFEELVLAHYDAMCCAAFALVRSRDMVEDIVQNVLRKLWMGRAKWHPRGPIRAYVLLATKHETISVIRRLRRERGLVGQIVGKAQPVAGDSERIPGMGAIPAAIDDALIAAELRSAIEAAAAHLSPACRTVFLLRWKDGLRQTEIAARLGLSIKTVEMQITRALKAIRTHLAEAGLL